MALKTIDILVHDRAGAYVTNTVKGKRASSTHSARAAAEKLGLKLLGDGFHEVTSTDPAPRHGTTTWRIHGDAPAVAR